MQQIAPNSPADFRKFILPLWLGFCIMVLLLFVVLALYNCPLSDDFYYALWMRDWGVADANISIYYAWGGRYFSNVVLTLCNSLSYSNDFSIFIRPYQLHSITHILLWVWAGKILFKRIPYLSSSWLFLVPAILFLQKSADVTSFFYWLASAGTYCGGAIFCMLALSAERELRSKPDSWKIPPGTFLRFTAFLAASGGILYLFRKVLIEFFNQHPIGLLCLFLTAVLSIFFYLNREENKNPLLLRVCFTLSSMACAGSSELAGAILVVCLFILFLWDFQLKKISAYIPMLIAVLALSINILAPATANRAGTANPGTHNWQHAASGALIILAGIKDFLPCLPAGLLFSAVCRISSQTHPFPDIRKLILFGIMALLMVDGVLPFLTLLKAGELPGRAINLHQFSMCLMLFLLSYFIGLKLFSGKGKKSFAWILIMNVLLLTFLIIPGKKNIQNGISDLADGKAAGYYNEFCSEQLAIQACTASVCEVEPLQNRPLVISSGSNSVEAGLDPPSWVGYKNNSYAAYYGKKSIFRMPASNRSGDQKP